MRVQVSLLPRITFAILNFVVREYRSAFRWFREVFCTLENTQTSNTKKDRQRGLEISFHREGDKMERGELIAAVQTK